MSGRRTQAGAQDDLLDLTLDAPGADGGRAPEPDAAAVAGWLGALRAAGTAPPGAEVALMLGHDGQLFVHAAARHPADPLGAAAGLVIGLVERAGPGAAWVSRRRLWSTHDSALDRAAAQVGARRGRFGAEVGPLTVPLPPVVDLGPAVARARARCRLLPAQPGPPLEAAWAAAGGRAAADAAAPRWTLDRGVGAALVDGEGRPLGAARNQAAEHRLLHAEVALLVSILAARGAPLPPGCRLYTTLQPCRLCAALIVEAGVSEVIFDEAEVGRFGRATALQALGRERRARPDEGGRPAPDPGPGPRAA